MRLLIHGHGFAVHAFRVPSARTAHKQHALELAQPVHRRVQHMPSRTVQRFHGFRARSDSAEDERRPEVVQGDKRQERIEVAMTLHGIPQGLAAKNLIDLALRK